MAWRQKPNLLRRTGDLPNVPNGIAPDLVGEIDREYWQSLYSLDIFDDSELAVFVNRMLTRFRFVGHIDSKVHRYFELCIDSITDDFATRVRDCLPVDVAFIDELVDEHSADDFMSLPYVNDPVHNIVEWRDMLDGILFYASVHSLNEKALDDENDEEEDSESILSKVTLFIDKPALINVVDIDAYLRLCIGSLDRGEELAIDYEVLRLPLNNGSSDMVHHLITKLSSSAVVNVTTIMRGKRIVILKKN